MTHMVYVKNADDIAREPVGAGERTTRQVLIGPGQGPHFAMRRFIIEPGGYMPTHTNTVEHEQYVLRGRACITIGGQQLEVGHDDVVLIPAGVPHSYRTLGDEAFEFLCVVPNQEDRIELVEEPVA